MKKLMTLGAVALGLLASSMAFAMSVTLTCPKVAQIQKLHMQQVVSHHKHGFIVGTDRYEHFGSSNPDNWIVIMGYFSKSTGAVNEANELLKNLYSKGGILDGNGFRCIYGTEDSKVLVNAILELS